MWLIVGLGNPGIEYAWTPHNLGFLTVDRLAELAGIRVERPEAKSLIARGKLAGQDIVLAKPQTMMNLSGMAVRDLFVRHEIGPPELIVVYDDVALPWGMIRVRERGTAGTHNGMKSVIGTIGAVDFCRVRIGVQPDHPIGDLAAYVLHPMKRSELEQAAEMVDRAAEAIELVLAEGVSRAMNRFNKRVPSAADEDEAKEKNS